MSRDIDTGLIGDKGMEGLPSSLTRDVLIIWAECDRSVLSGLTHALNLIRDKGTPLGILSPIDKKYRN
jgi:hypothetical protein